MEGDSPQFDALIGGTNQLPHNLSLQKFIFHRSQEIQIMKTNLSAQSGTKLAFQTLPKHMRRRAMSHNVKRLPRRLRQIHLKQMTKSGLPVKQKTPSRKYRRRPKNLTLAYTTRSNKKFKWLQTHIWHAKRFHMVEKWGYKLACHPRDKAFRANYRAVAKHCLLQDISYMKCIEIEGEQSVILDKLKTLQQPNTGLSIGAKAFINGNREGEVFLFESGEPIGSVNFHWLPKNSDSNNRLWIWSHPAQYRQVLAALKKCFEQKETVVLKELDGELCRLRLTGPLATAILQDAFIVPTEYDKIESEIPWFKNFNNIEAVKHQNEFWKSLENINCVSDVSPHLILSLIVQDPRYNLPKKRVKCVPEDGHTYVNTPNFSDLMCSPLYNAEIRKNLSVTRLSNAQIAEMRSNLLVPGSALKEGLSFLSVLLIQRPGTRHENIGLGSGWDLILPSIWVKPLWIAFVMRGARVGGLRETNSTLFEMGKTHFLQPDTEAGRRYELENSAECVSKYFRKPPNKRTNYNKFKSVSPFLCNWKLLLQDWGQPGDFVVLRNRNILIDLQNFLCGKCRTLPNLPENLLIPVKLVCEKKGSPKKYALICLPNNKDDSKKVVQEPICNDLKQEERKQLRKTHQKLLKKLRKRRKLKLPINEKDLMEVSEYTEKIRKLWLPPAENIRNSCSREVCGFVQTGGFSLTLGKSAAVGFIVGACLQKFIEFKRRNLIYVRNTDSRIYMPVKISIIQE